MHLGFYEKFIFKQESSGCHCNHVKQRRPSLKYLLTLKSISQIENEISQFRSSNLGRIFIFSEGKKYRIFDSLNKFFKKGKENTRKGYPGMKNIFFSLSG